MDSNVWISMFGYLLMDIYVWISMFGYLLMDIYVWISMFGYLYVLISWCLDIYGRISMDGYLYVWISWCLDIYGRISMDKNLCLDIYIWISQGVTYLIILIRKYSKFIYQGSTDPPLDHTWYTLLYSNTNTHISLYN